MIRTLGENLDREGLSGEPKRKAGLLCARNYGVARGASPDPRYSFSTSGKTVVCQTRMQRVESWPFFWGGDRGRETIRNKNGKDTNVCPHRMLSLVSPSIPIVGFRFVDAAHAAPSARRCWKHSRQKTGRPCVGRKGTVVSLPHCEQVVLVSDRICVAPLAPPPPSARLALQALQRFGSFLKPLSAKNICSPAVNTNSALHSEHFRTLSWNSMSRSPWPKSSRGKGRTLHHRAGI